MGKGQVLGEKGWIPQSAFLAFQVLSVKFSCANIILQSATWRREQSTPVTMCTHWEPRPRKSAQLPVFESQSATSGLTTLTSEGVGSRSQISEKDHRQKDQTLVRSPVVLQVGDICSQFVLKVLLKKTTSCLGRSFRMDATAPLRQQKVTD